MNGKDHGILISHVHGDVNHVSNQHTGKEVSKQCAHQALLSHSVNQEEGPHTQSQSPAFSEPPGGRPGVRNHLQRVI